MSMGVPTASNTITIVTIPADGIDAEAMLANAEVKATRMYSASDSGELITLELKLTKAPYFIYNLRGVFFQTLTGGSIYGRLCRGLKF